MTTQSGDGDLKSQVSIDVFDQLDIRVGRIIAVDDFPEAAFNLVGSIDDAIEKGKKLLAQAQG